MKTSKLYWILYRISGDSGVPDRGTYFEEFDNSKDVAILMDDICSLNDDRCRAEVIATNVDCRLCETD